MELRGHVDNTAEEKGEKKNSPKTVPQEKLRLDDKIQIQLVSKCFELYVQIEENLFTCKLDTRFHKYIFDSSFEARNMGKEPNGSIGMSFISRSCVRVPMVHRGKPL